MVAEDMFNFASLIEEDFRNAGCQAVTIAHTTQQGRYVAHRRFLRCFEILTFTVEKADTTVCHVTLHPELSAIPRHPNIWLIANIIKVHNTEPVSREVVPRSDYCIAIG
jgi:6-phosphogluconolactonase (cycloisomerase 2 family)